MAAAVIAAKALPVALAGSAADVAGGGPLATPHVDATRAGTAAALAGGGAVAPTDAGAARASTRADGADAAGAPAELIRLETVLREHPLLLGLQADVTSARERATSARALPDPEFVVGLNNFPLLDPSFDEYLPTNRSFGVVQLIPNGSVRRARAEAERHSARVGELLAAQAFASLRARLHTALIERERVTLQRELLSAKDARYGELVEVIQSEIDAGRPVVFRLSQIDVERADVARALVELAGEQARIDAELIDLVGYPAVVAPPTLSLAWRRGGAEDFHVVRIAEARTAIAQAGVTQAQGEYGPDFRLSLAWQQREAGRGGPGSTFDGDDWVSASLGFTLPMWGKTRQAPQLRAAQARRGASRSEALAAARASESRWAAHAATVESATRSIEILEAKLDAMDAQIAAMLTNYEAGLGDYSQVIDGEIARLAMQFLLVEERARRSRTIAQANALLVSAP